MIPNKSESSIIANYVFFRLKTVLINIVSSPPMRKFLDIIIIIILKNLSFCCFLHN